MSTQLKPGASAQDAAAARRARVAAIPASQRAAVIIAILGDAAAKPIVEKLDDVAMSRVAEALANISVVPREDQIDIVIDFLTQLRRTSGSLRGGRDKAREVLSTMLDPQRLSSVFGDDPFDETSLNSEENLWETPGKGETVWSRLEKRDAKKVAEYLDRLSPNIISLILRKLDVTTVSKLVTLMDGEKVGPVMGFMVQPAKSDPGLDRVLERMIEMEFLTAGGAESEDEDSAHLSSIGEILSLVPSDKRNSLVKFLEGSHEDKLRDIQKSLFTIESLPDILPKPAVPVLLRELDSETTLKLLASLRGQYESISEFLLSNISSRLAEQLREELADVEDLSTAKAEMVQRDFLTTLMTMKRDGKIQLISGKSADEEDAA